jgi:hypothetical protein
MRFIMSLSRRYSGSSDKTVQASYSHGTSLRCGLGRFIHRVGVRVGDERIEGLEVHSELRSEDGAYRREVSGELLALTKS